MKPPVLAEAKSYSDDCVELNCEILEPVTTFQPHLLAIISVTPGIARYSFSDINIQNQIDTSANFVNLEGGLGRSFINAIENTSHTFLLRGNTQLTMIPAKAGVFLYSK